MYEKERCLSFSLFGFGTKLLIDRYQIAKLAWTFSSSLKVTLKNFYSRPSKGGRLILKILKNPNIPCVA